MINQELRRLGIGGSEIGAIFGCDEERGPFSVWARKTGRAPEGEPTIRMLIGSAFERGVLELYEYKTGRELDYCNETSRHPERPYMVYTPDALCRRERRGVDAKVVSWDQRRKWGANPNDIPERVQLQCWWYMAAMEYDLWDVAAYIGDGLPVVYTIERDREAERVMLARAEEFYCRYLVGGETPRPDASDECKAWLQQAFPEHKRPDIRPATLDECALLDEYTRLRCELKRLLARRKQFDADLKYAIGEREGIDWEGGKITWRKTKDGETVNYKAMALGLLNELADDEKRAFLFSLHTKTKPGIRRLLLQADALRDTGDDEDDD